MTRTRKRDDDSQYKSSITSDGTSLALDVSSMSATGSRSSLTFASSQSQLSQKVRIKRPRKRRRTTLSDAMQSISLDRDVPQQILNMKHHPGYDENNGDYTYNVSFVGTDAMPSGVAVGVELDAAGGTVNDQTVAAIHANANTNANGAASGDAWTFHNHLNSQQRMDRRLDRHGNRHVTMNTGQNGGNVYYDCDENSQLTTSSSEEDEESTLDGHLGMDDAQPQQQQHQQQHDPPKQQHEDEDDQDDNSHGNKKKRAMTELEKAQRKVMLELVFGKNHREARKAAARKASCLPKETDTGPRPIRLAPGSAVPPVSVVATVTNTATGTGTGTGTGTATDGMVVEGLEDTADRNVPAVLRSSAITKDSDPLSRFRDPADRKIEELLRLSLKNVRKGSHPLALPRLNHRSDDDDNSSSNGNSQNDDGFVTTPWKTQDDMAIDPEIYSRPLVVVTAPMTDASPVPAPMKVEDGPKPPVAAAEAAAGASPMAHEACASLPNPGPEPTRFPRKRSNSLPGGLDLGGAMLGTTDMETDDG